MSSPKKEAKSLSLDCWSGVVNDPFGSSCIWSLKTHIKVQLDGSSHFKSWHEFLTGKDLWSQNNHFILSNQIVNNFNVVDNDAAERTVTLTIKFCLIIQKWRPFSRCSSSGWSWPKKRPNLRKRKKKNRMRDKYSIS